MEKKEQEKYELIIKLYDLEDAYRLEIGKLPLSETIVRQQKLKAFDMSVDEIEYLIANATERLEKAKKEKAERNFYNSEQGKEFTEKYRSLIKQTEEKISDLKNFISSQVNRYIKDWIGNGFLATFKEDYIAIANIVKPFPNGGEYEIPYSITINFRESGSDSPEIKDENVYICQHTDRKLYPNNTDTDIKVLNAVVKILNEKEKLSILISYIKEKDVVLQELKKELWENTEKLYNPLKYANL